MSFTGVFPCYTNQFSVGIKGESSTLADMKSIAEMESFSIKMDGKPAEWTPYDTEGWIKRLMTEKGFTISVSGKRSVGDPGNDYLADLAWKNGRDCNTMFIWNFPSGARLEFNAVINVSAIGAGKSTDIGQLEFDALSNGKPNFVPATAQLDPLTVATVPANNATSVAASSNLTLTFSNPISSHFVSLINDTTGAAASAAITFDGTKKIMTINPDANLTTGDKYEIIIAGVTDIYGQTLATQIVSFTVA